MLSAEFSCVTVAQGAPVEMTRSATPASLPNGEATLQQRSGGWSFCRWYRHSNYSARRTELDCDVVRVRQEQSESEPGKLRAEIKVAAVCPRLRCIAEQSRRHIRAPQGRKRRDHRCFAELPLHLSLAIADLDAVRSRSSGRRLEYARDDDQSCKRDKCKEDDGELLHGALRVRRSSHFQFTDAD